MNVVMTYCQGLFIMGDYDIAQNVLFNPVKVVLIPVQSNIKTMGGEDATSHQFEPRFYPLMHPLAQSLDPIKAFSKKCLNVTKVRKDVAEGYSIFVKDVMAGLGNGAELKEEAIIQ